MTPKEKAKDLVDEYFSWYGNEEYFSHEFAKECALIAIEEIQEAVRYLDDDSEDFWFNVKYEIQNL